MKTKQRITLNKVIGIICALLTVFCMSLLIYVTVCVSVHKHVSVFGYSLSIVATDSMTPEINVGDMVIAKKTGAENIKVGDDIVFVSADPILGGRQVVHRVIGINPDGSFVTSGIKRGATADPYPATEIIGKVTSVSTSAGQFAAKMVKNKNWLFVVIAVLAMGIAVGEGLRIAKLGKQTKAEEDAKKELRAEMEEEIRREHGLPASDTTSTDKEDTNK